MVGLTCAFEIMILNHFLAETNGEERDFSFLPMTPDYVRCWREVHTSP